jgi:hypothetical protein
VLPGDMPSEHGAMLALERRKGDEKLGPKLGSFKLCKILGRPWVLFLIGLVLLLLLFLLRKWLAWLLLFCLLILALIGLLVLALLLAALVRRACAKAKAPPKGQGSEGKGGAPSVKIPSHTYKRPDPLLYSQTYLMSMGLGVTWDNPDIHLELGNATVSSHELAPKTTYRIVAQVHNGSVEAPAVNLPVRFYYLAFGIGTIQHFIGECVVNLPVKGAPGEPTVATCDWTTPAEQGHYCIQVALMWPDDANPANNLGQENVDVKALNSPNATFQFAVRNDAPLFRTLRLEADSYTIPPLLSCQEVQAVRGKEEGTKPRLSAVVAQGRAALYERHSRAAYPVPADCTVEFLPGDTLALQPGEESMVTVRVSTDRSPVDRQAINVHAFAGAELVGGVTLYFHS